MEEMNIINAKYIQLGGENFNIKFSLDGVEMIAPISEGNRHYDEIMRQVAAGELTIADADPSPVAD